jgi:hypothetical protein
MNCRGDSKELLENDCRKEFRALFTPNCIMPWLIVVHLLEAGNYTHASL